MTVGVFQISDSFWLKTRAVVSTGPPGGNGTMKRTGRLGHDSEANAASGWAAASRLPAMKLRRVVEECMLCLL